MAAKEDVLTKALDTSVGALYRSVIDDVLRKCRRHFEQRGLSEEVIQRKISTLQLVCVCDGCVCVCVVRLSACIFRSLVLSLSLCLSVLKIVF